MFEDFDPFRGLDVLRREIDRLFEGYSPLGWRPFRYAFLPGRGTRTYPLMNLYEDEDAYHVEALAPGLDPGSLDVSVTGNTLTLSGEKQALVDVDAEAYHRNERAAGKFVRTLQLGSEVDESKVRAEYERGLLTVTMPKSERAKTKSIQVQVK